MIKKEEKVAIKAIVLCYKPYLKPEEACLYCDLGSTQLKKRCEEHGVYRTAAGYYKKEELDKMMAGDHHGSSSQFVRNERSKNKVASS